MTEAADVARRAGAALVTAVGTDQWLTARDTAAELLSAGSQSRFDQLIKQLDLMAADVLAARPADSSSIRSREDIVWETRFLVMLESDQPGTPGPTARAVEKFADSVHERPVNRVSDNAFIGPTALQLHGVQHNYYGAQWWRHLRALIRATLQHRRAKWVAGVVALVALCAGGTWLGIGSFDGGPELQRLMVISGKRPAEGGQPGQPQWTWHFSRNVPYGTNKVTVSLARGAKGDHLRSLSGSLHLGRCTGPSDQASWSFSANNHLVADGMLTAKKPSIDLAAYPFPDHVTQLAISVYPSSSNESDAIADPDPPPSECAVAWDKPGVIRDIRS
ncbi:hypothetical protein PV350_13185 [Streptomyces sp. PA03-6a]|nr:hypothetical protein [Streptomyces sp. PA03-6a]